jgi:hypothetical protein
MSVMLLRTIASFLVVTGFLVCAFADEQSELSAQMERFHKASTATDAVVMEDLLADNYLLITRTGTTNTKKVYLDRLQAATTPGAGITPKYQPVQTRVYGNTGIVTERESLTTPQGSTELITTSVWIKDQGHWKLVLRQNTLLR